MSRIIVVDADDGMKYFRQVTERIGQSVEKWGRTRDVRPQVVGAILPQCANTIGMLWSDAVVACALTPHNVPHVMTLYREFRTKFPSGRFFFLTVNAEDQVEALLGPGEWSLIDTLSDYYLSLAWVHEIAYGSPAPEVA